MGTPRRLLLVGLKNVQFPVFSVGQVVYIRGLFHSALGPGRGFELPSG
jgi:hypothetical protein